MKNQASINSYQRAVKALLYFAMEEEQGYIEYFRFKLPKEDCAVGSIYTESEIKKLLKKLNFKTCYDGEYKIWVVVNYMLETGNRLSTVRNIKVNNVYFEKNIIMLNHTKNRDAQFIPLTNPLSKLLKKYICDFGLKEEDFLFPTVMGKA
ncbi:tyrosine-type recombinase/integrase [Proteiniclasticum ruminis]|uniref:Phage integrase family protein n=1 Tax=Proteiniclasticum ruminis TaxID=398199 RepID=A0A1I5CWZ0_9CLOT|nr:tyrosine-type recombinase/integrase [Proteiniclasticum ruminis]SFN91458.1 Phage integrase family protein [Proteiniclasticum ruminis]